MRLLRHLLKVFWELFHLVKWWVGDLQAKQTKNTIEKSLTENNVLLLLLLMRLEIELVIWLQNKFVFCVFFPGLEHRTSCFVFRTTTVVFHTLFLVLVDCFIFFPFSC